jgi:hypothetical protein
MGNVVLFILFMVALSTISQVAPSPAGPNPSPEVAEQRRQHFEFVKSEMDKVEVLTRAFNGIDIVESFFGFFVKEDRDIAKANQILKSNGLDKHIYIDSHGQLKPISFTLLRTQKNEIIAKLLPAEWAKEVQAYPGLKHFL